MLCLSYNERIRMEDMAQDFGWSLDDDLLWEPEAPTAEELAAEERSQLQMIRDEEIGQMYAARYAFD
jgi:hypothetical protein